MAALVTDTGRSSRADGMRGWVATDSRLGATAAAFHVLSEGGVLNA